METKGIELKPCPFCGSENVIFVNSSVGFGMWVSCNDCETVGPTCQTKEEAERAWNHRYELPNEPLTLDELLQMDEPVWCSVGDTPWIPSGGYWCLCKKGKIIAPSMSLFDVNTLDLNDWVFYRRRPEEE